MSILHLIIIKFPSENGLTLGVHNIDEFLSAWTTSLIWQNKDYKCRIIECRGRIKEGVLDQKVGSCESVS